MSTPSSQLSPEELAAGKALTDKFLEKYYPDQKTNSDLKSKAMLAILFYKNQGYARDDETLLSEIAGIDFTKDVRVEKFDAGSQFNQMQRPGKIDAEVYKGNYYTRATGTNSASDPNFIQKFLEMIKRLVTGQSDDSIHSSMDTLQSAANKIGISDVVLVDPVTGAPIKFDTTIDLDPGASMIGPKEEYDRTGIPAVLAEKQRTLFKSTEGVLGLVSTAKQVDDTWSTPGITVPTSGGGEQVWIGPKANDKITTERGIRVDRIMERITSEGNILSRVFKSQDLSTEDRVALVEELAVAYGKLAKFHKFGNEDACQEILKDVEKLKGDLERQYPQSKRDADEKVAPTGLSIPDILNNIGHIIDSEKALTAEAEATSPEKKSRRP